jgi:DNA polymerase
MAKEKRDARPFIPPSRSRSVLEKAVDRCKGCDLYKYATQGVFGEGPARASVMFVGEQPGDQEDKQGVPFVGPAGRVFNDALMDAGIERSAVYVTNAVKHFKHVQKGKRRLHQKPNTGEVVACRPWLETEVAKIKPKILVAMGATAARSLFGKSVTISSLRGNFHKTEFCERTYVTVHPSSILRAPPEDHKAQYEAFVADLKKIAKAASDLRFTLRESP